MANEHKFPETIKLRFMEDKYKYRPNGHYMIMVYSENGDSLPNDKDGSPPSDCEWWGATFFRCSFYEICCLRYASVSTVMTFRISLSLCLIS